MFQMEVVMRLVPRCFLAREAEDVLETPLCGQHGSDGLLHSSTTSSPLSTMLGPRPSGFNELDVPRRLEP